MRRFTMTFAAALICAAPSFADTAALAREYIELPSNQAMVDDMFSAEAMAANFLLGVPPGTDIPAEKVTQIGQVLSEGMATIRPKMMAEMEATMTTLFTEPELEALIAFYKSEHGATVMQKTQGMMQTVMANIAPEMNAMQQETLPKILEIMQAE